MKRFLSIDWDFFIDATLEQRFLLFPDGGNENLPTSIRDYIWDSHYRDPELEKIGVTPDYKFLLQVCKNFTGDAFIADSHKWAYDFITSNTNPDEEFEVYNIDFHHDLYNYKTGDERVNCGNWGTILREDRPNVRFIWIKCEDSDTMTIGGVEAETHRTMDLDMFRKFFHKGIDNSFDYLYLCRSSVWSPPHLDKKFVKAVNHLIKSCNAMYEGGIDEPRAYEIPTDFAEIIAYADLARRSKSTKN